MGTACHATADMFPPTQLYAVLILTNAGVDLEHCTLQSLVQAKSILFQVCLSLASIEKVGDGTGRSPGQAPRRSPRASASGRTRAPREQKYRFEHRDLHWGNILTVPTSHQTVGGAPRPFTQGSHGTDGRTGPKGVRSANRAVRVRH